VSASFTASWLAADPRALSFLPDHFRHPSQRALAVENAGRRAVSPALLSALKAYNAALPASAARDRHLEALSRPGTVCVVTGQQAGLFLGPLFTLYKAASAVMVARALERETGRPCVPVFWLQSEDHDLPEINTCGIPTGRADNLNVALKLAGAAESRIPVAHWRVGPSIAEVLSDLRAELGAEPDAEAHLALLERFYAPEATVSGAFAALLSTVFSEEGLIVVDLRDPAVGRLAAGFHTRALDESETIASVLTQRTEAMKSAGFDPQVHVRPRAPLAFFSPDAVDGPRYRMEPLDSQGALSLVGHPKNATVTTSMLRDALTSQPLRFTTSALLRPLLQDTWFPVAAYVGGPAEVAYFSQIQPVYRHLGMEMPLVVPRARFRILETRVEGLLQKLGMSADDVSRPHAELVAQIAARAADEGFAPPESVERDLLASVIPQIERLGAAMTTVDPMFSKSVTRTQDAIREAVSKLVGKYQRGLAQRDQVTTERLERVRASLVPGGIPQERVFGLPYFAARYGARNFLNRVLEATEPFSGALKDLKP